MAASVSDFLVLLLLYLCAPCTAPASKAMLCMILRAVLHRFSTSVGDSGRGKVDNAVAWPYARPHTFFVPHLTNVGPDEDACQTLQ